VCYNKIAVKILIVGDKEIYVTLIYWNGGGCSALYNDFRRCKLY